MSKAKTPTPWTFTPEVHYRCPECEELLEEGERRCGDCGKFGSRVEVILMCPHCDEPITGEDM